MQPRKIALVAVLLGALVTSYAFGRQNAAPDAAEQFGDLYEHAKTDNDKIAPLFDAYAKLPGDAITTKQAARLAWSDGDNRTFQIIQTMQNQKIIEQNARIIELLEKNAKK